jgi:hypothetical protein
MISPQEINKLYSLINFLDSINPLQRDAYNQVVSAFTAIRHLPVFFVTMHEQCEFSRTRTHENYILYNKISDLGLPPRNAVKEFARCNTPFQPVFYASENRPTSYMELVEYWAESKPVGSKLYVTTGRWITNKPVRLLIVTSPNPLLRTSQYDKIHGREYDEFFENADIYYREYARVFYNYLFERFRRPAKNDLRTYIITTAYTNIALSHIPELDGIAYPSVPFGNNGVNVALTASCAKNCLTLTHALNVQFEIALTESKSRNFKEITSILTDKINSYHKRISWI